MALQDGGSPEEDNLVVFYYLLAYLKSGLIRRVAFGERGLNKRNIIANISLKSKNKKLWH
jgi:hypothetical protein